MSTRRQIRELALQALYQYDARGADDYEAIAESIESAPHKAETKEKAMAMAKGAWGEHKRADKMASEVAPSWPTLRQPVVDRSLLRLAYYEMACEIAPQPVAINEAIELAKTYGSEKSPSFINGVLDKMARILRDKKAAGTKIETTPENASVTAANAWLDDALETPEVEANSTVEVEPVAIEKPAVEVEAVAPVEAVELKVPTVKATPKKATPKKAVKREVVKKDASPWGEAASKREEDIAASEVVEESSVKSEEVEAAPVSDSESTSEKEETPAGEDASPWGEAAKTEEAAEVSEEISKEVSQDESKVDESGNKDEKSSYNPWLDD